MILLPEYVIELVPETIVPDSGKPIVESTLTTEDPIETVSDDLVFDVISKLPKTVSCSFDPINNSSL